MQLSQAQEQPSADDSPLAQLGSLFAPDMAQVNKIILDHMQSDVPLIPQLAGYLIASGGKRLRPLLTLAATRLFDENTERPYGLAAAVEFIHTATLLHDDVVDESGERRGKQAANLVFGNQASVLVGDFLFSRAFQLMVKDGSVEVLRILSDASATITQGEVLQLSAAHNIDTDFAAYENIIKAKTAALFAAACEIGPVVTGQDEAMQKALHDYGHNLGIAFQMADDALDYSADREKLGKNIGDDFREGKITAPVLIALSGASDTERAFWQRTLGDGAQKDGDLEQALSIISKHNAINKGMALARDYAEKAQAALTPIPDSALKSLLLETASYAVEREC